MYISATMSPHYDNVIVWEREGDKRIRKTYPMELQFFVQHPEGEYKDIYDNPLRKLEYESFSAYIAGRKAYRSRGIDMYESDIPIEQKVLSKHYYGAAIGELNITYYDIEVDYDKYKGYSRVTDPYAPINSISMYHSQTKTRVILAVPPQNSPYGPSERKYTIDDISPNVTSQATVILCKSERELLDKFLYEIGGSDLMVGWNSDFFDMPYIYKRIITTLGKRSLKRLCFEDSGKVPTIRTVERQISVGFKVRDEIVKLFGRTQLDYKTIYEKFEQENKASYALAYTAEEEFPDLRKLEYEGSLYDLYRDDFSYYLEYNMIDTEILVKLEEKLGYIALAQELSHDATAPIDKVYGTISIAELSIINTCHYELNQRVPDTKRHDYFEKYGGAVVLDCQVGEHGHSGAVDVKSLYPTAIIAVNASPETIIGQFELKDLSYNAILRRTGEELIAQFEDGTFMVKTTHEWFDYFIESNYTISGYGTIFDQNKKGFIPAVLETWFSERGEYKAKMSKYADMLDALDKSDPTYAEIKGKKDYFYRLQYIKKIQLNSLYGCMGNKFFKFFDIRLAESTTKTGREILLHMARHIGLVLDGEYTYPNDTVIYGDTDSCYFKTHTKTLDDAKAVCKYVEKSINESFPSFMKTHFNSNSVVAKRVQVENEIVSDVGIFVSKKIYLLHLIEKDGRPTDELKIMGHAIKKTTVTPVVKKALTASITEYFKNHDWPGLNKNVVKFKNLLETTDNLADYGIPGKVNKVEHYTERFEANEESLRISGRCAASIFWNICLKQYGDKESMPITSQLAVRVYYLEQEFGRFKSIAVPADLLTIPDWFTDNFVGIIDREKQVEKLVDMTLRNICNAIGKQIPTEKAVMADDLLVY